MNHEQKMDYYRRKLPELVREVSALNGGDTEEFLQEYIAEVLRDWANDLQSAVACFTDLREQSIKRKALNERIAQ